MRPRSGSEYRYFLKALIDLHLDKLLASATGSTFPNVSREQLANLDCEIPPLSEQYAIAGMLGALDDKIELNRRMNRTLESVARAVFREMMKDVEEQGSILEFANLLSGGTPSTTEGSYWNGNIEWVSAKDVSNANGVFLLDTEKKITQEGIDNSATKLLPEKTVIVTARGTVGAHCMLGKPMTMNQTNYGLKAKEGVGDYFVYFTLSEMVEQLKQQSYGTIFDTITTKTFRSALCAQPPIDAIQKLEDQVTPLMDAILNNQRESRTLASLRDSLLPKLMRGEVRVKDVEK
jgi:type I restriction enzyme S subunit